MEKRAYIIRRIALFLSLWSSFGLFYVVRDDVPIIGVVIALLLLVALEAILIFVLYHARIAERRRQERDKAIREEVEALEREHPELARMQRLMELTQEVKDEQASRRSFWVGFGQNAFFLVLGFVVSYILSRLGVL